jgi:hypothetical protein
LAARFICGGRVGRAKVLIEATRMALTDAWQARRIWKRVWFSDVVASSGRRNLRMASGLILFTYIGAHLTNHALGLISLNTAERGMEIAVEVWYSVPGTLLLYGAAATHFILALWAVYERRTFRLPPLELLRIALGFTLPIILIGHAANTRGLPTRCSAGPPITRGWLPICGPPTSKVCNWACWRRDGCTAVSA